MYNNKQTKLLYEQDHATKKGNSFTNLDILEELLSKDIQISMYVEVKQIEHYEDKENGQKKFKYIKVLDTQTNNYYHLQLFDYYRLLEVNFNDQLYLQGLCNQQNFIKFENSCDNTNIIVLKPLVLLSPTGIAISNGCQRQKLLGEAFQFGVYGTTQPITDGEVAHDFFQHLCETEYIQLYKELPQLEFNKEQILTFNDLRNTPLFQDQIKDLYEKYIKSLYYLELQSLDQFVNNISPLLRNCLQWVKTYIIDQKEIVYEKCKGIKIVIKSFISTEQYVSDYRYGFKGYVDLIVKAEINENGKIFTSLLPVELKGGRGKKDYYADQLQTYMLLLDCKWGILLYLRDLECKIIELTSAQSIINQRNRFLNLKDKALQGEFPSFPYEIKFCNYCDKQQICAFVNVVYENRVMDTKFEETLENYREQVKEKAISYLTPLMEALKKEELTLTRMQMIRFNNESVESIVLSSSLQEYHKALQWEEFYQNVHSVSIRDLQKSYNAKIQNITLREVNSNQISLEERGQNSIVRLYQLILQVSSEHEDEIMKMKVCYLSPTYRNYYKNHRATLISLITNELYELKKEKLVNYVEPIFKLPKPEDERLKAFDIIHHKLSRQLSKQQIEILTQCLKAEDYALVDQSSSETILYLIFLLSIIGKRVLICTLHNKSLDELITEFIKLFPLNENQIVRLGNDSNKIDSYIVNKYWFNFTEFKSTEDIKQYLDQKQLYFTLISDQFDMIQQQEYDYCIVNEATEIIEPQCLGIILNSKKFILFGNDKIPNARTERLKISLFQRLRTKFPNCCI